MGIAFCNDKICSGRFNMTNYSEQIKTAYEYTKAGNKNDARKILEEVLSQDSNNEWAWYVFAHTAKNRQEAIHSLEKVLEINPKNIRAKTELDQLQEQATQQDHKNVSLQQPKYPQTSKNNNSNSSNSKKTISMFFGGCGVLAILIIIVIGASFLFGSPFLQEIQTVTQIQTPTPLIILQPTPNALNDNCNCELATAYLERLVQRYDQLEDDTNYVNEAISSGYWINSADFSALNGRAKMLYKEQVRDTPPPCLDSIHKNTISLFWNWQQALEYAADEQYEETVIFLQGFSEKYAELNAEIQKTLGTLLKDCPNLNNRSQPTF